MTTPGEFTEDELAAAEPVRGRDLVVFAASLAVLVALVALLAAGGWP